MNTNKIVLHLNGHVIEIAIPSYALTPANVNNDAVTPPAAQPPVPVESTNTTLDQIKAKVVELSKRGLSAGLIINTIGYPNPQSIPEDKYNQVYNNLERL